MATSAGNDLAPAHPVRLTTARALTKSEAAYVEIRQRILCGLLEPGSAIDQERAAENLGLSTTPVREALRRLEAEGWVSLEAHREARVRHLTRRELDDLYQLRFELDPLAAGLACATMSDEEIQVVVRLASVPGSSGTDENLDSNRQLHRMIYVGSGNQVLAGVLDQLWDRSDRYRLVLLRSDPDVASAALSEHREIIEALAARKAGLLRELMREHLISSHRKLQLLLPA